MMKPFRSLSTLRRFNSRASGDFSFIWYGDKATIMHSSFTFLMPHQYRQYSRGVSGSQY